MSVKAGIYINLPDQKVTFNINDPFETKQCLLTLSIMSLSQLGHQSTSTE